jgi:hypothetical protein
METSDGNLSLVGVGSTGMRNCARMVKYENLSCGKSIVLELVTHLIFRNLNTLEYQGWKRAMVIYVWSASEVLGCVIAQEWSSMKSELRQVLCIWINDTLIFRNLNTLEYQGWKRAAVIYAWSALEVLDDLFVRNRRSSQVPSKMSQLKTSEHRGI